MNASLPQLQRAMQRSIMSSAGGAELVSGSDASDSAQRLAIYATAYRLRLRDALAHNFPMLQAHLGAEAFNALADAYLDAHPSIHVSVRAFGSHLAEWLQATRPSQPWLAEFAQFEWSLDGAFDAIDAAPLAVEAIANIEPDRWAQVTFGFAPSVARLTFRTNAVALYGSSALEQPVVDGCVAAPTEWLVWRQALTAQYRSMTVLEALTFDALQAGNTFGAACELMFEHSDDDSVPMQAAAFLKRWLADELIVGVAIAD